MSKEIGRKEGRKEGTLYFLSRADEHTVTCKL